MLICTCRKNQVSQQVGQRLYALSNLDELRNLTFETFQLRGQIGLGPRQADSLEQAFNHAQQFSQSLEGWLLLQGGYGAGKTHLAAAIANFSVSLGIPTLCSSLSQIYWTRSGLLTRTQNPPLKRRFEEIRRAPLLILDDFGTQNATGWAQEKLFQIIELPVHQPAPTGSHHQPILRGD